MAVYFPTASSRTSVTKKINIKREGNNISIFGLIIYSYFKSFKKVLGIGRKLLGRRSDGNTFSLNLTLPKQELVKKYSSLVLCGIFLLNNYANAGVKKVLVLVDSFEGAEAMIVFSVSIWHFPKWELEIEYFTLVIWGISWQKNKNKRGWFRFYHRQLILSCRLTRRVLSKWLIMHVVK